MPETVTRKQDAGRQTPSTGRQAWTFTRHFLEMCVAMCVGGTALNALVFVAGPALLGYPDLRETAPQVALLIVACLVTVPMAAWMRFRGMARRPILEMSAAPLGLGVVLAVLAAVGVLSPADVRGWALAFCGPACIVMLPVMLLRLDMYTGRTGEHAHHGAPARGAQEPGGHRSDRR
jgi:hypothetical protein